MLWKENFKVTDSCLKHKTDRTMAWCSVLCLPIKDKWPLQWCKLVKLRHCQQIVHRTKAWSCSECTCLPADDTSSNLSRSCVSNTDWWNKPIWIKVIRTKTDTFSTAPTSSRILNAQSERDDYPSRSHSHCPHYFQSSHEHLICNQSEHSVSS